MAWTKDEVLSVLMHPFEMTGSFANRQFIYKMLLSMAKEQTPEELSAMRTFWSNNRGFDYYDAEIMSRYAKKLKSAKMLDNIELADVAFRLRKYHRQLVEMTVIRGSNFPVIPTITGKQMPMFTEPVKVVDPKK